MTVAENVAFGLRMEKLTSAEVTRRTGEYLELVGLAGLSRRLPSEMSGGQQQRVALARALAKRPAVLLLDEPLGALDLKLRKNMQTELSRIHRQVGTTFVFVTHDQDEALSMDPRIAIMSGGRIAQTGTPREVYDKPVNRFVADFVGETNFLPGTVESNGSRPMFAMAGGDRVVAPSDSTPGPATLMVRPESVTLRALDAPAAEPGITGRIVNIAFLGNHTRITLTTAAGDIVAVRPHGTIVRSTHLVEELGEEVSVWWPADDAALIGD
jgi:spermidine/putrescine transport system ATP-binding protein